MITAYLVCAVAGFAFMGLSALAGHFGGHGHTGDLGGGHGHGGDAHGGGSAGHLGDGGLDLPFFSPTAVAAYVTGFGSAGLIITQGLHVTNPLIHVPASIAFAASFGVGVLAALAKLTEKAEGNSLASVSEIVGLEVEVSIAIPVNGEGEVAYVSGGTRQTALARAEAGQRFAQGARVRVSRVVDGAIYVTLANALPAAGASVGEPVEHPPGSKDRTR